MKEQISTQSNDIGFIASLHPAAQVTFIIGVTAICCIFIWQFWKTIREF